MKRQKVYRPKTGDSRVAREVANRMVLMRLVQQWWTEMANQRVMYQSNAIRTEKIDYQGQMPWPDAVSFLSLYEDFIIIHGDKVDCSHGQFAHYLHVCTPLKMGTSKSVKIRMEDGGLLWSAHRTFIQLPRETNG